MHVRRGNAVGIRTAFMNIYVAQIYDSETRKLKEKVTDVSLAPPPPKKRVICWLAHH